MSQKSKSFLRIVAMARAGGSLTARLLDSLPGTACYPFEARFVGTPERIDYPTEFEGVTVGEALKHLGRYDMFRRIVEGEKLTKDRVLEYDRESYYGLLDEPVTANNPHELIEGVSRAYFSSCKDFTRDWDDVETIIWHDAKGIWSNLDAALSQDPLLKLIVQFRHPLEWLIRFDHMYKRRGCSFDLEAAMSLHSLALANAIDLQHKWQERIIFVRYEDMVSETGQQLRRISDFAGLNYDGTVPEPTILGHSWVSNSFLSKPGTGVFKTDILFQSTDLFDPEKLYRKHKKLFDSLGYDIEEPFTRKTDFGGLSSNDIITDNLTIVHNVLHDHYMAGKSKKLLAKNRAHRTLSGVRKKVKQTLGL